MRPDRGNGSLHRQHLRLVLEAGKTQIAISFGVEVELASTSGCPTCSLVGGLTFDGYDFDFDGFSLVGGPDGASLTSQDGTLVQGHFSSEPPQPLPISPFFVPEPGSALSLIGALGWTGRRARARRASNAGKPANSM